MTTVQRVFTTVLSLLAAHSMAAAATITGNATIDLRSGVRTATSLFSDPIAISPVTLQQGDTLDFTFGFARGEMLRFDSSTLPSNTVCGGQECFSLVFLNSQGAAPGLVLTNGNLEVIPFDGALVSKFASSTGEDCLGCAEISGKGNLTDATASISGGRITASIEQMAGSLTYDSVYLFGVADNPRILVHRDFQFDLSAGVISTTGIALQAVPVPGTLILDEGDEYDFGFSFANGQAVQISSSTLPPQTACGGQECISLVMLHASGLVLTDSTVDLTNLSGDVLVQALASNDEDCVNCVEFSGKGNLTDGTVQFTGGRFQGRIESATGPATLDTAYMGIGGDNAAVVDPPGDVPEPSAMVLTGAGLILLGRLRRRAGRAKLSLWALALLPLVNGSVARAGYITAFGQAHSSVSSDGTASSTTQDAAPTYNPGYLAASATIDRLDSADASNIYGTNAQAMYNLFAEVGTLRSYARSNASAAADFVNNPNLFNTAGAYS